MICMSATTNSGAAKPPNPRKTEVTMWRSKERPTTARSPVREDRSIPVRRTREVTRRLRVSTHSGVSASAGLRRRTSSRIRPSSRRVSSSARAAAG